MVKIDPYKKKSLEFKMDIVGSVKPPQTRLILNMVNGAKMMFEGVTNGEVSKITLPVLQESYKEFTGEARLEVVVENFLFPAWSDTIEFKTTPKISAMMVESTEDELGIGVAVNSINESEEVDELITVKSSFISNEEPKSKFLSELVNKLNK